MEEIKKEFESMMYYLEKQDHDNAVKHLNILIFLVLAQANIKDM